jgi:polysaccharide export outer membrane protein
MTSPMTRWWKRNWSSVRRLTRSTVVFAILVLCTDEGLAQYRLQTGDVIEVSVYGVADFKRRTAVSLDGDISLPLLGDIQAAGLTLAELRVRLKEILAKSNVIRSPDVTADLVEPRPVYVNGHIAKPGAHPFQAGMTVRHAIAIAGGYDLLRHRLDNPMLLAADLRSQYENLWTEFVRREARVASLQAELGGDDQPDLAMLERAPVARRIIADLVKLEMDYFNVRRLDQQKEREYLQQTRRHAEDQVKSLTEGQELETSAIQLQAENIARTQALSKQGLAPLTRLTEEQRLSALQRSRQLENSARLADARRILGDYGRRLQKADDEWRLRLLREQQEAIAELEKVRTQLQSVGEKLLYVGAMKAQIVNGSYGHPEITIYRKVAAQSERLPADENMEVFPGDVIDIAFSSKQLLLSGR